MTSLLPWPWLLLPLLLIPTLHLVARRLPERARRSARWALTVGMIVTGIVAATDLVRLGRLLAATPWPSVVLDATPIRERIEDATALLVRDEDIDASILAALADDDLERAQALERLAMRHGRDLDPATREALEAAGSALARALRQTRDLARAAATGRAETPLGLGMAVAVDLTVVGDLRDIATETARWSIGEEPDRLILGLAGAGLAATLATLAAPAAGGPALLGKAVLKTALRTGRAGSGLVADLRRTLGRTVDTEGLGRAAAEIGTNPRAVARFVRMEALAALRRPAAALGDIASTAGPATALAVVRAAERIDDLPTLARVARVLGKEADDALVVLGRRTLPALRLGRTSLRIGLHTAALAAAVLAAVVSLAAAAIDAGLRRSLHAALRSA